MAWGSRAAPNARLELSDGLQDSSSGRTNSDHQVVVLEIAEGEHGRHDAAEQLRVSILQQELANGRAAAKT